MSSARSEELLQLWQDGDATDAQLAELETSLRNDPELRKALVGSVLLEADLYARYAGAPAAQVRPSRRWFFEAAAALLIVAASAFAVGKLLLKEAPQPFDVRTLAPASFALKDGSSLVLDAGSAGLLRSDDDLLELDRGSGSFKIDGRTQPFRISTPGGSVSSLGGEFSLSLRPLGMKAPRDAGNRPELRIQVSAGRVDVDSWGYRETVLAGDRRTFGPASSARNFARLLEGASVTMAEAIDRATAKSSGTALRARLEDEDGKICFAVELARGAETVEVDLDAKTGDVADQDTEASDRSRLAAALGITLKSAVEKALQAVPGRAVEAEFELEGRKVLAEIKILTGSGEVREVNVDGVTGEILKEK